MFSFFKKKIAEVFQGGQAQEVQKPDQAEPQTPSFTEKEQQTATPAATTADRGVQEQVRPETAAPETVSNPAPEPGTEPAIEQTAEQAPVHTPADTPDQTPAATPEATVSVAIGADTHQNKEQEERQLQQQASVMPTEAPAVPAEQTPKTEAAAEATQESIASTTQPQAETENNRTGWLNRLKTGLKKTGMGISSVFGGSQIDDSLFDDLEDALLMADAGVGATTQVIAELRHRVKTNRITSPDQVKSILIDLLTELLQPLQKQLQIGEHTPTVIMVAGVNGAGKTTSIGKLTKHLSGAGQQVLLAAADTFRAAAREQLAVWADRNTVEIISNAGGDPAALSFDAVTAGRARGKDVVLVDTAGRLPTQLHLMDELKKIRRTITKADASAPHEVLLVIDGNTGQNALAQVKAFDDALQLTGLIVTKLDGTAKGGVLCAIARERHHIPVYFIGVGESLEDLQTFNAREFAQALVG